MERQCRICLDTEDQQTLISPCLCRGSAEFIHQECLERYVEHYPDGICRVCLVKFHYQHRYTMIFGISLGCLGTIILALSPQPSIEVTLLFLMFLGIVGLYWVLNAFTTGTVLVSMFLLLAIAIQEKLTREVAIVFIILLFLYTLFVYIPQPYLMMFFTIVSVTCYTFIILITTIEHMTPNMGAFFLVIVYLTWNAIMRVRPPLRFNNR